MGGFLLIFYKNQVFQDLEHYMIEDLRFLSSLLTKTIF